MPTLELKDVCYAYEKDREILSNVHTELETGKLYAILADEPTGNLDADTTEEITAVLKERAHAFGRCVVVVTYSAEVARQADVVLEIKRGQLKEREME